MPATNKVLFLHIGLPKTGTSFLQYFLCHNSCVLIKKGIFYPDLATGYIYNERSRCGARNGNAYSLAYSYLENQSITNCPEKGIDFYHLAMILKVINSNVLLSSEWLTLLKPSTIMEIYELASAHGYNIKIICYIRRQDLFIESSYNQKVKLSREYITFDDFIYIPNFYGSLNSYIDTLPDQLINIRCMEKCQLKNGNIIDDFLSCLGIENSKDCKLPDKHINKSLSYGALNLLNVMNKNGFVNSTAMHILIATLEDMPSTSYFDIKHSWLSPIRRHELMKKVETLNANFAKRFLGRGTGQLFFDPLPAIDSRWMDARNQLLDKKELETLIEILKNRVEISNMNDIIKFIYDYKIKIHN